MLLFLCGPACTTRCFLQKLCCDLTEKLPCMVRWWSQKHVISQQSRLSVVYFRARRSIKLAKNCWNRCLSFASDCHCYFRNIDDTYTPVIFLPSITGSSLWVLWLRKLLGFEWKHDNADCNDVWRRQEQTGMTNSTGDGSAWLNSLQCGDVSV